MPYLFAMVISFVPVIVKKILALLGVGLVTYVGADYMMNEITQKILSSYNNIGTDYLMIAELAGVHIGINMLLATYSALVTLHVVKKSSSIVFGG
jgi:hypothetical protein